MKKQGEKLRARLMKKPPKLNEETKKKTDHLYIAKVKNLQNLARKTGKKT